MQIPLSSSGARDTHTGDGVVTNGLANVRKGPIDMDTTEVIVQTETLEEVDDLVNLEGKKRARMEMGSEINSGLISPNEEVVLQLPCMLTIPSRMILIWES